jgi:hypothetical protein
MLFILSTRPATLVAAGGVGEDACSTRALNLELQLVHSKIPTCNWGCPSASPGFLNVTGQLLTGEGTSAPQLGHLVNVKASLETWCLELKCVVPQEHVGSERLNGKEIRVI